jgi:hypothetical protein
MLADQLLMQSVSANMDRSSSIFLTQNATIFHESPLHVRKVFIHELSPAMVRDLLA